MKTIILQSDNNTDLDLLIALANRLGVSYSVASPTAEDKEDDLDILLEGLGLEEELTFTSYEEFSKEPSINTSANAHMLYEALQEVGGAWEDDEDETLEDLLNMLTP